MDKKISIIDRILFSPINAQIAVTRRCNLSCGYCNEYDKVSRPVSFALLKKRLDKLQELGTMILTFTGGEPFLHPDMIRLVEYSSIRFYYTIIITNAYLVDEKIIECLNAAGLKGMQISVDCLRPNDITKKALNPIRKRLEMISKKARFKVNINSVVGAADHNELKEILSFAKKMGFSTTMQLIHDGTGKTRNKIGASKEFLEIKKLASIPLWNKINGTGDLEKDGKSFFKCRGGGRYLYVDEDGFACWCSQTRGRFKKPLESYTFADLKEQFYKRKGCEEKCSIGCVRSSSFLDSFRRYG